MEVVVARVEDWPAIRAIYEAGIRSGDATFETEPPSWEEWDAAHLPAHRLVARADAGVVGWAALSPVSSRRVYAGVVEDSVYVAPEAQRRGVGRALLTAIVEGAERAGIWTVEAGVFPENAASLALHRALGFRTVGVRERLGLMPTGPCAGRWRDVVLVERRSAVVGTGGG